MGRLLLIAVRNLLQNRRRTLLLGGAIATVTALLVLLSSASNGIQDTMLRGAETLSTGHVNVAGFFKITSGQAAPVVTRYRELMDFVEKEVPEAESVVDRLRGWGKIVSHASSIQVGVSGVDIDKETAFSEVLEIVDGDIEGLRKRDGLLLFESQAKKLEVGVGDMLTISSPTVRGAYNAVQGTVVAVAKNMGFLSSFGIFSSKQVILDLYLLDENTTGAIHIYLKDHHDAAEVAERLRKRIAEAAVCSDLGDAEDEHCRLLDSLAQPFWMKFPNVTREGWTGQKIDVTTWEDEMQFLMWTIQAFDSLTFALVSVLLTIIVIGVMNSLWMAIRERTKEIGTLRAIGMGRGRVLAMFVIEAGVLAFGATVAGALLGSGICLVLNGLAIPVSEGFQLFLMRETLYFLVEMRTLLVAVTTITVVVTLFSLLPARKAAKMPPITAIHHIG